MADQRNLTVDEAAQWLGISPTTVYRLVKRGKLPGFKVGGVWRFNRERLATWEADQETMEHFTDDQRQAPDDTSHGAQST